MDFFEFPLVEELGQDHVEGLDSLTSSQAESLYKIFLKSRRDLLDKLMTVKAGSFSEQHLRMALYQVEQTLGALKNDMSGFMDRSATILSRQSIQDLANEVNSFSKEFTGSVQPINLDAVRIAMDTQNFLFNKYDASVSSYTEGLRSQLAQGLTESMIQAEPYDTVINKLGQFFMGEEWKIQRIARTELNGMYNLAKNQGMLKTRETVLPDLQKALFHPMDDRTGDDSKLAAKLNLVVDVDEPFSYRYKGKLRTFFVPPDRPNDRSILIPYRKEWGPTAA